MAVYKDGAIYKPYKGDHGAVSLYHGSSKIGGYHTESQTGVQSAAFQKTYNDTADVIVYGDTVQASDYYAKDGLLTQYQDTKVMGKNLFNSDKFYLENSNQLSWDGTALTVNDYASGVPFNSPLFNYVISLFIPGKTYTVTRTIKILNGTYSGACGSIRFYNATNNSFGLTLSGNSGTSSNTFTVPSDFLTKWNIEGTVLAFYGNTDGIGDRVKYSNIQIEEAGAATAYEPYKDYVKTGLVLDYSGRNFFNNPQTTVLPDRSGNGNNGTCYNFGYTSTSGSDGSGNIVFDGVNDYINVQNNASLNPTTSITVSAWIYWSELVDRWEWYVMKGDTSSATTGYGLFRYQQFNNIGFYVNGMSATVKASTFAINNWYHIVGTAVAGGAVKLYVNGTLVKTAGGVPNPIVQNSISLGINYGSYYGGVKSFKGKTSNIAIYNRALSASEIYQNYFAGVNLNVPSPTDPSPVVTNLPAGTYKYISTDGIYEFTLSEELRGIDTTYDKIVFDRKTGTGFVERAIRQIAFTSSTNFGDYYPVFTYNVTGEVFKRPTLLYKSSHGGSYTFADAETANSSNVSFLNMGSYWGVNNMTEWNAFLVDQNNKGTPVTCYFARKNPIRTAITFTKVTSSSRTEVPMTFLTSTPSLDYPATIFDVENENIVTRGKNLFNFIDGSVPIYSMDSRNVFDVSAPPYTVAVPEQGGFYIANNGLYKIALCQFEPYTQYTISLSRKFTSANNYFFEILVMYEGGTSDVVSGGTANWENKQITTRQDKTIKYILLRSADPKYDCVVDLDSILIEKGTTKTSYVPYSGYDKKSLPTLRKIGSIADTYNPKTGILTKRISDWTTLTYPPITMATLADPTIGFKNCYSMLGFPGGFAQWGVAFGTKYDSAPLTGGSGADKISMFSDWNGLLLGVSNADSGWNESFTPNVNETRAYFYGWKMCNADGTSPYYYSEVPYTPATWAEWVRYGATTADSTGLEFTADGNTTNFLSFNTTLKPSTNYGVLFNVVSSTLTGQLSIPPTQALLNGINFTSTSGNKKGTDTTGATITTNVIQFKTAVVESSGIKVKLKNIRIFELPSGSQIKTDFANLTADQLVAKYTFNGLCVKNWKKITDGTGQTATLPTASYEGYTPYKMLYQLATPVETQLTPNPIQTFYPNTVIETDATIAQPTMDIAVRVEDA